MTNDQPDDSTMNNDEAEAALTLEQLRMEFLTVEEVAKLLRIGKNLAYELVREGVIPSIRLGNRILVPREALARALQRMTTYRGAPAAEPAAV